jgi:hypothetical protein
MAFKSRCRTVGAEADGRTNPSLRHLNCPNSLPGKHRVRCEIESAFVATRDMAGLAEDATSVDWPPAKRRWTRVCEAEFMVYPTDAEIVSRSDDPALNPVAGGALSAKPIIIRPERGRLDRDGGFQRGGQARTAHRR